jgi:hypothetical protein
MDYLKTSGAKKAFIECLSMSHGDSSLLKEMWDEKLKEKKVITQDLDADELLPVNLIGDIQTNLRNSVVLSNFKFTYNVNDGILPIDTSSDSAWGHKKLATKKIQHATFEKRPINTDAIYKLQNIDQMTFLKGGPLIDYILRELPAHVIAKLEQAILVGGVVNEDGTPFDAVYPLLTDKYSTPVAANSVFEGIIRGIAAVDGANKVLFISAQDYSDLLSLRDDMAISILNNTVNFGAKIVPTNLLPAGQMIVVNTTDYLVGFAGKGLETLSAFEIKENAQYIESRAYVAGSIMKSNAAAVVTVTAK